MYRLEPKSYSNGIDDLKHNHVLITSISIDKPRFRI